MYELVVISPSFTNEHELIVKSDNKFVLICCGKLLTKFKLCFACVINDEKAQPIVSFVIE